MKSKNKTKLTKAEKKSRFSIIILFSIFVFLILLLSILVASIVTYILFRLGVVDTGLTESPDLTPVFLIMSITSIVIGSGVTILTCRYPLKPVTSIITQLNRLAQGDFKARINFSKPLGAHPAFKEMSDSFNKMAEELGSTEMLRSDFINNFSHEFKTPIVSIAGFAKLLKKDNISDEQKIEYVNIIEEESLRLAAMANNVLNLTKIENQTILTNKSKFNVSEQIRSCVLLAENKWMKKNLEVSLEFDEYYIDANEELLKEVWINLIDNAIKFSPEYGFVDIKISSSEKLLNISISNSGNIPAENQKRIFNKFYQGDISHSSEGSGIGLSIVKKIVELHEGKISVTSENDIVTFCTALLI